MLINRFVQSSKIHEKTNEFFPTAKSDLKEDFVEWCLSFHIYTIEERKKSQSSLIWAPIECWATDINKNNVQFLALRNVLLLLSMKSTGGRGKWRVPGDFFLSLVAHANVLVNILKKKKNLCFPFYLEQEIDEIIRHTLKILISQIMWLTHYMQIKNRNPQIVGCSITLSLPPSCTATYLSTPPTLKTFSPPPWTIRWEWWDACMGNWGGAATEVQLTCTLLDFPKQGEEFMLPESLFQLLYLCNNLPQSLVVKKKPHWLCSWILWVWNLNTAQKGWLVPTSVGRLDSWAGIIWHLVHSLGWEGPNIWGLDSWGSLGISLCLPLLFPHMVSLAL